MQCKDCKLFHPSCSGTNPGTCGVTNMTKKPDEEPNYYYCEVKKE